MRSSLVFVFRWVINSLKLYVFSFMYILALKNCKGKFKEVKGIGSKNCKEVDQCVVFWTVDQKK